MTVNTWHYWIHYQNFLTECIIPDNSENESCRHRLQEDLMQSDVLVRNITNVLIALVMFSFLAKLCFTFWRSESLSDFIWTLFDYNSASAARPVSSRWRSGSWSTCSSPSRSSLLTSFSRSVSVKFYHVNLNPVRAWRTKWRNRNNSKNVFLSLLSMPEVPQPSHSAPIKNKFYIRNQHNIVQQALSTWKLTDSVFPDTTLDNDQQSAGCLSQG